MDKFFKKYAKRIFKRSPYPIGDLTTDMVYEGLTKAGKSAGGTDGWQPAELALVSRTTCSWIRELFVLIESGKP